MHTTPPASEGRSIAHSTLWQIASQLVMAALSIVTTKFVAMGLSQELAGHYNTAYGYLQLFGILADFGLYAVAVREVSRAKDRPQVLGALMVLRLLILAVSLGSALIIAWAIPHWRGTPLPLAIVIAAFVPAFTLAAGMLRTVFQVEHRMQYVFAAEVTMRVITVTLIGAFILSGIRETADARILYAFLAIGGLGSLALLLATTLFARRFARPRFSWDPVLLKRLAAQAAPYGLAFFCTALYRQFDVTLIGLFRPQDFELQNAYYGFVQRMLDMGYILPTFLLNSALPSLTVRAEKGEDARAFLGKIFLSLLLLGSTTFLFAFLWPRPLVALLTTPAYLSTPLQPGSDTALQILSVSMFGNGIITFGFYVLLTRHRWKPLVMTLALGVLVSLSLNALLIPSLGFVGASLTSVVTHVLLAALLLPQSMAAMRFRLTLREIGQWLLYTIGLAAALFLLLPFLTSSLMTILAGVITALWMAGMLWGVGLLRNFSIGR